MGGGRIRPPLPCVSYEATKRMSRWQRIYSVELRRSFVRFENGGRVLGCRLKSLTTILKHLVPNLHSTHFPYGATWYWLSCTIPRSQHSPPPPLKFFHIPSSPPLLSFPPFCAGELGGQSSSCFKLFLEPEYRNYSLSECFIIICIYNRS